MQRTALDYAGHVRELHWSDDSEEHIWRHGFRPAEVEEVVNTRPLYTTPGREGTELIFGMTAAGRYLLAVLAEAFDGRHDVVPARDLTDTEGRTFRRQAR